MEMAEKETCYVYAVVFRLVVHTERAVVGVVPFEVRDCHQVESGRARSVVAGQVVEPVVADPVVARLAAEALLEVGPGSVEVEPRVVALVEQLPTAQAHLKQARAEGCKAV